MKLCENQEKECITMNKSESGYKTQVPSEKAQLATTIAKILWYTGKLSLQRLAWFLEISVDEVENLVDSDEYLDAIVELIRTRPDRTGVSIEDWWINEWKDIPQRFSERMRIPETAVSGLIERAKELQI